MKVTCIVLKRHKEAFGTLDMCHIVSRNNQKYTPMTEVAGVTGLGCHLYDTKLTHTLPRQQQLNVGVKATPLWHPHDARF